MTNEQDQLPTKQELEARVRSSGFGIITSFTCAGLGIGAFTLGSIANTTHSPEMPQVVRRYNQAGISRDILEAEIRRSDDLVKSLPYKTPETTLHLNPGVTEYTDALESAQRDIINDRLTSIEKTYFVSAAKEVSIIDGYAEKLGIDKVTGGIKFAGMATVVVSALGMLASLFRYIPAHHRLCSPEYREEPTQ